MRGRALCDRRHRHAGHATATASMDCGRYGKLTISSCCCLLRCICSVGSHLLHVDVCSACQVCSQRYLPYYLQRLHLQHTHIACRAAILHMPMLTSRHCQFLAQPTQQACLALAALPQVGCAMVACRLNCTGVSHEG